MQITIDDIQGKQDFSVPGKAIQLLEIRYHTDSGYKGLYTLKKSDFDKDTIGGLLMADAEDVHYLIGKTLKE